MNRVLLCFAALVMLLGCKEDEPVTSGTVPGVSGIITSVVLSDNATVTAEIVSDGGTGILQKGFIYADHPNPQMTDSVVTNYDHSTVFTSTLTGLQPSTTYYIRAFATNAAGSVAGVELMITTLRKDVPAIATLPVTGVTQNSAVTGGEVTDDGGSAITSKGICWSRLHLPTTENDRQFSSDPGKFYITINNLEVRTTYYVRAFATNSNGTSYGTELSVTTADTATGQPCPGLATVEYDGKIYNTVLIGTKCWFRENLNAGTKIPGNSDMIPGNLKIEKYCYNDDESNCDLYGGLYQWDEMMQGVEVEGSRGVCPIRWHVPNWNDWNEMITLFGGFQSAGFALKFNTLWNNLGGTNLSGFGGLPGGLRYYNGQFTKLNFYGYYWSSQLSGNATQAFYYGFSHLNSSVSTDTDQKVLGFSVRCVSDSEIVRFSVHFVPSW